MNVGVDQPGDGDQAAALDHDPAPEIGAIHPEGVVRPVPDLLMGLARGLDVRPDAAVPEQVDRRPQDRRDELAGRERVGVRPDRIPRRRRQGAWFAERPEQGMRVNQKAHAQSVLPRSRAMSSGQSSKSSARRIRPSKNPRRRFAAAGS